MSGERAALLIGGCAVITAVIKAAGPVLLGGRPLPAWLARVVAFLAPAILSALVVTQAAADGDRLGVGADTAGVAAAGLVVWRGGGALTAVGVAVVVTAGLRALG